MATSEIDPEMTVIKSKVTTISQTKVTAPKSELEEDLKEFGQDIGKIGKNALKSLGGFRTFILRGNVVDLAIGIVIGAAFTSVVTSLVSDVITPLIPLPGKNTLGKLATTLPSPPYQPGTIVHIGSFINAIISFLIVAAVLYFFVVKPVNAFMKIYNPKETEAKATRDCPYCFQAVHHQAKRCPFCTSHLQEEAEKHEEGENDPVLQLPASLEKLSETLSEKIVTKTTLKKEMHAEESGATAAAGAEGTPSKE